MATQKNTPTFVNQSLHRAPKQSQWQKVWAGAKVFLRPLKNPRILATVILIGVVVLGTITAITYAVFANSLATPEAIINRKNTGLIFYDRTGKEFYRTGNARDTTIIPLSDIPKSLQNATIAIEDKDFYKHGGFSIQSIGRSILTDLRLGDATAYGGSTITQQLVKNSLLTQQKSFLRKFQELVLSIEIDRRYSKEQILSLYLTSTYYGSGAFGVRDAAETYFGKPLDKLDAAECAMIAGLPQAPSAYSPLDGDRALGERRQQLVLQAMEKQGYLTESEYTAAKSEQLQYVSASSQAATGDAPHFAEYVQTLLAKTYGEDTMNRSGFKIYTTLDLGLQQTAQADVAKRVERLKGTGATNGGLVAIDPKSGEILAMVGSADYNNDAIGGKVNIATAMRQPGSATKPFMYLTAFGQGYTPATILHDQPTDFNGYKPLDADRRFRGDVTVRRALANSLNIPAVEMLQKVGVGNFIDTMHEAGETDISQDDGQRCGLSIVLGCSETQLVTLTHAYATLADEGTYHDLVSYTKIIDKNGNQIYPQKTLGLFDSSGQNQGKQVLNKSLVYLISNILGDNVARSEEFGLNSYLKLSRPASVKTGTTDDSKDAWAVGYTPQAVMGVWVGSNVPTPMTLAGATGAAPIWHDVMESYLRGKPVENYNQPDDVVQLTICKGTEAIADNPGGNTFTEYFVKEHLPKDHCNTAPTPTPTPSPSSSPSATPLISATPTPTAIPTTSLTPTPSPTPTPTPTPSSGFPGFPGGGPHL